MAKTLGEAINELRAILDEPVDVRKLIRDIPFDVDGDGLERASLRQNSMYLKASRLRVQFMHHRARLLARLEEARSAAALKFRKKKDDKGKKEYTNPEVEELVTLDSEVKKIRRKLDNAYEFEEYTKLLLKTISDRQFILQSVGEMRNSEINAEIRATKARIARDEAIETSKKMRRKYDALSRD